MDKNINDIWQKTLQNLKTQLSDVSFDTWIRVIQPLTIKDNEIVLKCPKRIYKEYPTVTLHRYDIRFVERSDRKSCLY